MPSHGTILCQYNQNGAFGSARTVAVTVSGQASNVLQYFYDVDKGEITGVPAGLQVISETEALGYVIGLSNGLPPSATVILHLEAISSNSNFNCNATPPNITIPANDNGTTTSIVIKSSGNLVDEGTDAVAYTCSVVHTLETVDPQYSSSPQRTVTINVINDDQANVHLWTISDVDGSYEYDSKLLSFYNLEGDSFQYGLRLDTEPQSTVRIEPIIVLRNGDKILSPPILTASPKYVVFGASNWSTHQRIVYFTSPDRVDNNLQVFEITHDVITDDGVFREKATAKDLKVVVNAADDDTAGMRFASTAPLTIREGETGQIAVRLTSEPLHEVHVHLKLQGLLLVSEAIVFNESSWRAEQHLVLKAEKAGSYEVPVELKSQDLKYNGTSLLKTVIVEPLKVTIPRPSQPVVLVDAGRMMVSWTPKAGTYEIQWATENTFAEANASLSNRSTITIPSKALAMTIVYTRVRQRVGVDASDWSIASAAWTTTSTCDIANQYLDAASSDPLEWKCAECPEGASCIGDTTWKEVKALFGWWRHSMGPRSNFSECLFPPACLGASNPVFRGKFVNASGSDPSMVDSPEQCALRDGYAQACDGDGSPRCRLCATCANGYRRRVMDGMARCDKCPKPTENRLKIAGGGALAMILLACLVRANLGSEGKRTMAEMLQIIILDYLQLSSLVVAMDVPWPDVLQVVFNIQGVISTIGEHLLSPDCELTNLRPADVVYQKQIGYLLLPFLAILCSWVFWRVVCHCKGHKWTSGEPSYEDKHISTVIFLLYLLYPTMCNSGFTLLRSETVDGRSFLYADLQEPYMEGRHLSYVLLLSGPQLAFVFGLPILGLKVIWGHQKAQTLSHIKTQFRYGMLYSGYQYKCWWWDMVVAYRKLAISLVTTLAPDEVEIHILIFVLVLALYLNQQWKPYTDEEAPNRQERESLHNMAVHSMAMVFGTAWSGFYFKLLPHCENSKWSCTMLMVVVALGNAAFFTYCLLRLAYAHCRERMPDVEKHKKRAKAYFRRRGKRIVLQKAEPNPLAGAAFENPMYRAKRKSTMKTSMQAKRLEMRKIRDALEDRA